MRRERSKKCVDRKGLETIDLHDSPVQLVPSAYNGNAQQQNINSSRNDHNDTLVSEKSKVWLYLTSMESGKNICRELWFR